MHILAISANILVTADDPDIDLHRPCCAQDLRRILHRLLSTVETIMHPIHQTMPSGMLRYNPFFAEITYPLKDICNGEIFPL